MVFDPTLVRGMSYYTGTIFEISMPELGAACGGGGRYDKMVGKFTGQDVPACGFSIGFERIILLLMESGFTVPTQRPKVAYLIATRSAITASPRQMKSGPRWPTRKSGETPSSSWKGTSRWPMHSAWSAKRP